MRAALGQPVLQRHRVTIEHQKTAVQEMGLLTPARRLLSAHSRRPQLHGTCLLL